MAFPQLVTPKTLLSSCFPGSNVSQHNASSHTMLVNFQAVTHSNSLVTISGSYPRSNVWLVTSNCRQLRTCSFSSLICLVKLAPAAATKALTCRRVYGEVNTSAGISPGNMKPWFCWARFKLFQLPASAHHGEPLHIQVTPNNTF